MELPPLASEFPPSTPEAWRGLVDKVLKVGEFDRRLVGRTADGIRVEPLYAKAENAAPVLRAAARPWRVGQRLDHPDPAAANALALADLEGGCDLLTVSFAGSRAARGFGLVAKSVDDLDRALAGVMLDIVEIALEPAPFAAADSLRLLAELVARRGQATGALTVHLGFDPIGDVARTGNLPMPWSDLSAGLVEGIGGVPAFRGTALRIDARAVHEAGASEAQEIGYALAAGIAYLRALESGGIPVEDARCRLSFLLVADPDQFATVAKFRAIRRLWAALESACGLAPRPMRLGAETAWRSLTRHDPWVNLLRGTTAALSAGIAGADDVTILPFTAAVGLPDAFARRIARNTQLILLEEANLWRVADPVAGAGGYEALTDALAQAGWDEFQRIEREGGIVASLASGALGDRIAAMRERRDRAVDTRREAVVGVSEFPHLAEAPVEVLRPAEQPVLTGGLPSGRVGERFERLRDRSDSILAATGRRPRVFLANLGSIAAFSARTTFARNAFEAGGIEAVTNDGFPDLDALVSAFRASGAQLACLCSSDTVYAAEAVPSTAALTAAGGRVYLAGRPGALESELQVAGLAGSIAMGDDLAAFLEDAQAHA